MYTSLRDCAAVVTVFDAAEDVKWNFGGNGGALIGSRYCSHWLAVNSGRQCQRDCDGACSG